MSQNYKKDYVWNTIGVLLQNAISPLLLIAVTRINGIEESGIFSFAFSVAIILWAVAMWGGRTYQVSDVKQEFSHKSYIVVRLLVSIFIIVFAVFFSFINQYDISKSLIIIALVSYKAVEAIADAVFGVLQVHNRLFIVGKSLVYKAVFGFSLFLFVDMLTNNLLLSCATLIVTNLVFLLFYDLRITAHLEDMKMHYKKMGQYIRQSLAIMKVCLPVFLVTFMTMFPLNIPRYFVDIYHQEQIGYFGIIAMPVTLIVLVVTFMLQPNVLNLSKLYENKKISEFNSIVKKLTIFTLLTGIVILLVTAIFGTKILSFIFGLDFDPYFVSLVVLTIGSIANAIVAVFIVILTVMRSLKSQLYILASTNLLLVPASLLFVPQHGLLGGVALFLGISLLQAMLFVSVYYFILRKDVAWQK